MRSEHILLIAPIFKTNYGIHFTSKELQGCDCNAWHPIPIAHDQEHLIKPNISEFAFKVIEEKFIASQLAHHVVEITWRGQDLLVRYEPMPADKHAVLKPKGWEIESKNLPTRVDEIVNFAKNLSLEEILVLLKNSDLLKQVFENNDPDDTANLLRENTNKEDLDQVLINKGFTQQFLEALLDKLTGNEILETISQHLPYDEWLDVEDKKFVEFCKEYDIANIHETYLLIEELKKRYHRHDLDALSFIEDIRNGTHTALLLCA